MRKYLTIGELADLMKTSTSSIRFYEKQGLLSPCKIDDNGYRLYDFNEIDRLETIMLLRKMDVPLKELKTMLNNNSIADYMETLKSSLTSIDSRIQQLKNKRQYIVKKIKNVQSFIDAESSYTMTHFPERILYCIHTGKIFEYTLKDTYDIFKSLNIDYSDAYQDNFLIPLDNDNYSFCIMNPSGIKNVASFDKIILSEGLYLNYDVFIQDYESIDIERANFYNYMKNNDLLPIGSLAIIENQRTSDYYLQKINIRLQIRVEDSKK